MTPAAAVVDASVSVKWVVAEADSEAAFRLAGARLHAPDLWVSECANVLWKKVLRGDLSAEEAEGAATALQAAEVRLAATRPLLAEIVALAAVLRHPAYDCAYLVLARRLGCPLITADRRLVEGVRAAAGIFDLPETILLSEMLTTI